MKNIKKAYIILGTTILSISAFTGCNKPENNCSLVSTFSSSIINANKAIVQRDGYKVDAEIGLNEGQAIDREDGTEENKIDADGSAIGTDGKTNEELEQEINAIEDQKVTDTSNFSGGDVDYSNEPWYVEGIDYSNDNNGQGYDKGNKHFDTWGEYVKDTHETTMSNPDFLTDEELETLGNGGTIMN